MRPSKDEVWMNVAREVARLSTCLRRSVGCVLIDVRGHVSSTGNNGVHSGAPHCNDRVLSTEWGQKHRSFEGILCKQYSDGLFVHPNACEGAGARSGTSLDLCEAIHAEQNALLQCKSPWELEVAYVTTAPCVTCTKLLIATSCQRIVFQEGYQANAGIKLWTDAGRVALML